MGLLIHAIQLVDLRTVSISDAALDLDASTQGGFMISIHVTHILVIAQSETKCICVFGWRGFYDERRSGVLESAVCQD